ncbi:hypothetical protein FA95DRAFT_1498871 [Auriscalpium vulgare]|uniref:Uncharacterized protein n=1 Tax=Auriscalpium vulgare TaxID=40419 RepID=A0ACB8RG96_9AGAM|nr:hypothetical protein FA95DRAFT_1498871 [Auriscalpium vulgare]
MAPKSTATGSSSAAKGKVPDVTRHGVATLDTVSTLDPHARAGFAVTSRLLASIVTESLLRAYYVPLKSPVASGVCVILSTHVIGEPVVLERSLRPADVFAIVPLHHEPVLKGKASIHGSPIWLLDPLDMLPAIYQLNEGHSRGQDDESELSAAILSQLVPPPWELGSVTYLSTVLDPLHWWGKFAQDVMITDDLRASLADELESSYTWQRAAYESPPPCPTLDSLPIEWEQCLLEGHPTHPMHRARRTLPPLPAVTPADRDWHHPRIRFALVPRKRLEFQGAFEREVEPLTRLAAQRAGKSLPDGDDERIVMPLYDLQVTNVREKFPDIEVLGEEFSIQALGQVSIRTVVVPEIPRTAYKLAVGIKVSSALRTISHFTANLGPRFSQLVPKLAIDPRILHIERETASAIVVRDAEGELLDPDVSKHFTAVFREQYSVQEGEAVVVCAALLEWGHPGVPTGIPLVQHILGLDTERKRIAFFDEYTRLLVAAVVPALLHNGLAFEAHAQNTLLRISRATRTPIGFVMRDLGGLRVHAPTLCASTGVPFAFLPDHCVVTASREEAAKKLYHTLVHNHLQRLVRVLGLHYSGTGWKIVRRHLEEVIPQESWLWKVWMAEDAESVSGKCLVRMKLHGVYRDSVYEPFPNLIKYQDTQRLVYP